jgi:rare lipoprotein A (peptidoglycan hydrolase)
MRHAHSHAPRWLMVAAIVWALFAIGLTLDASIDKATAAPAMTRTTATWYGPGFYGNGFACGGTYREKTSRGVAHMTLPCGTKLVVCSGVSGVRRCVWVQVIDTGNFNPRHLDLTARTARDLIGCRNCRPYTMPISWRKR